MPVEHLTERHKFSPAVLRTLVKRELVTLAAEIVSRDPFARRAAPAAAGHEPSSAQRDALATLDGGKRGDGLSPSRHHRQRQDARLHRAAQASRSRARKDGDRARARDRAHAADRRPLSRRVRRRGRRAAQRAQRRRAVRRMARAARGTQANRRRRALGDLRAAARTSARSSSTKSTSRATSRARRRGITRARSRSCARARRRDRRARQRDAEPRELGERGARRSTRCSRFPSASAAARLPDVDVVDRREASRAAAVRPAAERDAADWLRLVLSEDLEHALSNRLAKKEQSILLLNRRGYAAFVQCETCGFVATCPNCSISLTYHRTPEAARLSLLPPHRGTAARLSALLGRCDAPARPRHAAGRASARRSVSVGAHRAHGRRHDERQMGARRDSRPRRQRRGGHPARHADDRQGIRLSERDARRRRRRGRRHQPAGLSRVRALLSALEPGRGTSGPRTARAAKCSFRRACRTITPSSAR